MDTSLILLVCNVLSQNQGQQCEEEQSQDRSGEIPQTLAHPTTTSLYHTPHAYLYLSILLHILLSLNAPHSPHKRLWRVYRKAVKGLKEFTRLIPLRVKCRGTGIQRGVWYRLGPLFLTKIQEKPRNSFRLLDFSLKMDLSPGSAPR